MKVSLSLVTLLLSSIVTADLSLFGGKSLGDGAPVPGDNPLSFCKAAHDDDILVLKKVNLTPNPPLAGKILKIEAVGELLKDVEAGAYVTLQVKYGLIRLVNQRADLCEQVGNVDLECPIKKGKTTITKDVELPNEIPPGTYTVLADAYTVDDKPIVCLEATVTFAVGGMKIDL